MAVLLTGCASNKPTYQVHIPVARSAVLEPVESLGDEFEVRFRTDAEGNKVLRTVESEGTYVGSDRESLGAIQAEAERRMVREAIDQVNGVFISARTEVTSTAIYREDGGAAYRDFQDKTMSKLVGFARIQSKNCSRSETLEQGFKVVCQGRVQVPEVEVVKTRF